MKEQGLVSIYTVAQYKPQKATCNESKQANELNREFYRLEVRRAIVSDLTPFRVVFLLYLNGGHHSQTMQVSDLGSILLRSQGVIETLAYKDAGSRGRISK